MNEYKQMWLRWSDFSGSSSVREYWMAFLVNFLISIVLFILGSISGIFNYVSYLYSLILIVPAFALFVRRMHDTGKSGWYWLWLLLPIIGWIIVLIALIQTNK